jgi:translation initiation factor IF-3
MTTLNDHNKDAYRKMKETKAKQKEKGKDIGFKDIMLTINSESNDVTIKAKQAKKFLDKGGKVRVAVGFKAWDNEPIERAREMVEAFKGAIGIEVKTNTTQGGNSKGKKFWAEIQKA